ncbi:MAG: cyclic pyranopterin monophosphate synthase MoaC [Neisseria sp.]|nr:cyclic pyranopterin monophosphate synthase MoaC [Neisseria sp.]
MQLTHLTADGAVNMVDVADKAVTMREARAVGSVLFPAEVYAHIRAHGGQSKKGSIAEIARIAGIMAAKKTSELIPLCHPLMLEKCRVEVEYDDAACALRLSATVGVTHKTGVEMEALTAVSVAALTVYDMTKALSHEICIQDIRLAAKKGGKRDFGNDED